MSPFQAALMEADRQTERQGVVWETLRRIVEELDRLNIPYVVVGGLALQHYGIQRSTQDVDLLIGHGDLERIHDRLIGHGYRLKSPQSRHLRDEITRVRVEFLLEGEYPGDGKPKSVRFPSPDSVSVRAPDGVEFVDAKTLVEMKLASAKSAAHRIKDRADVLELIHTLGLGVDYADRLDPYVREEFRALAILPPPSEPD